MVIRYFSKSTFAAHHLLVLRLLEGIPRGLIKIGNTRFLCIYYAIHALLPCLRPISELINSGVLKVTRVSVPIETVCPSPTDKCNIQGHKLAWMKDINTFRAFKDRLHQLHLMLQPLARAVVCLESTASTPGDVYHLWIAVQATLHDLFLGSDRLGGLALPRTLVSDTRALVNGRFGEFLEGPEKQVYLTAFFLDFRKFLTFKSSL